MTGIWRSRRRIVNGIYFPVIILCPFAPVFLGLFDMGAWKWSGLIISSVGVLAGITGNLLANVIQRGKDGGNGEAAGATLALAPDTLQRLAHDTQTAARQHYLTSLLRTCQALPLAAMGGDEEAEHDLTLDHVYIALDTTTQLEAENQATPAPRQTTRTRPDRDQPQPLTALAAAQRCTRLALLGEPGAGKSTFVRLLLGQLIRANMGATAAPPGFDSTCLPVFMTLRDLAPRLDALELAALDAQQRQRCLAEAVWAQAGDDLRRWQAEPFQYDLQQALRRGQCLLVLDGLDEVPPDLRQRVREAVAALLSLSRPQRVIVTCRVRSYVQEAVLPGFEVHTLAPFDDTKVRAFIQAWYRAQQDLGRVDAVQRETKVQDLQQAALSHELRELAANPMLLTTMAIIHQRETRLPHERVRLYKQAVELLLRRWQRAKVGEELSTHPVLRAVLLDENRLRGVVEGLAYAAHCSRQNGKAVTDLPRGAALTLLEQPEYLGNVSLADAFLEYVDQRAGLLLGQGGAPRQPTTYSFPHRTFQEYLAGCHVMGQRQRDRACCELAGAGDTWGLAVQLGAEELLYNRRGDHELLDLAYGLCPHAQPADLQACRALLWSGNMAVLLGRARVARDRGRADGGEAYLERLIASLLGLLGSELTAPERADAGIALAQLGDPRFRAEAWYLPDEPLLGFVEIPAGEFVMGSDDPLDSSWEDAKPAHRCTLPGYYLARYPVTVAQFQAFVTASGYQLRDDASLRGVANHPVVYVSWHDALAYCAWLTAQLKTWDGTPEPIATLLRQQGWRMTLPSEAEWERAARGCDGRVYPWGEEEPDALRANFRGAGVQRTSTVGCFPAGATPDGIQDLGGNVWEWTRSLLGDYPYPADLTERAERESLQASQDAPRVLRGGAFWNAHQGVRCAYRLRYDARGVNDDVGFRVVVRP